MRSPRVIGRSMHLAAVARAALLHRQRSRTQPLRAHGFAHERADRRRMRTSAHGHQVHLAPELRLDQWPHHDIRALRNGILRHEGEAEAGRDHGKNPIVAVAAIHAFDLRAALGKNIARNVDLLAVDAVEVALAVEITDADLGSVGQPMLATEHDEELFTEQRKIVKPLVDLVRPAIDGGLQSAVEQAALKVGRARVHDLQLDAGILRLQVRQESDEIAGADRAHDPEFQRRALELDETRGKPLRLLRLPLNLFEIGTHRLAELAQMGSRPLAMEQEPAELVLQQLDGARERRLRHVAFLGRAGEVQLLAQGEEIPDLMHFHGDNLSACGHAPNQRFSLPALAAVGIAAGFHFDKWPLVSHSLRVTTMSPRYRSHRRSVLALAPARMVECRGRKRYRKLIAMSQLVVASNNPALSCPLRAHAHDLRNLLATVGLHLETLQRLSG